MKKAIAPYALIFGLSPFLLQCVAAEKEVKSLDLRVRTMDTRLVEMERTMTAVKNQAAHQAEIGNSIDQLNSRLLRVEGQLDESSHRRRKLEEENQKFKTSITSRVEALDDRLNDLNTQAAQISAQLDKTSQEFQALRENRAKEAAERAAAAARAAEEAEKKAAQAAAPREIVPDQVKKKAKAKPQGKTETKQAPTAPTKAVDTGKGLYVQGIAQFKAKKYKEAYNTFSEYLDKHPKGDMAANARFWLGNCLYSQKEYELAILEYQKVIADFPKSPKAAAALLKQGLAFEELHEPDTAKIVYNKLLDEYPKSEQEDAAKKRLKALKK